MRPPLATALAALLAGALAAVASLPPSPAAAALTLRDQLGGSDSVADHRGRVTVVMVVTAARLRNLKAWQRDLQQRFPEVDFVLVADIPPEPPVTHEQVAGKLVLRVPPEVPVLIDLERRWAGELGLDTARPNLLLFDRDGRLVDAFRGRSEEPLLEEVASRVEALLRGG